MDALLDTFCKVHFNSADNIFWVRGCGLLGGMLQLQKIVSIEWKVALNEKVISKDTEINLLLATTLLLNECSPTGRHSLMLKSYCIYQEKSTI